MAQQRECEIKLYRVRPGDPTSGVTAHCLTHGWTSKRQPGPTSARRSAGAHKRQMQRRDKRGG
jgi:hypothetical protein